MSRSFARKKEAQATIPNSCRSLREREVVDPSAKDVSEEALLLRIVLRDDVLRERTPAESHQIAHAGYVSALLSQDHLHRSVTQGGEGAVELGEGTDLLDELGFACRGRTQKGFQDQNVGTWLERGP